MKSERQPRRDSKHSNGAMSLLECKFRPSEQTHSVSQLPPWPRHMVIMGPSPSPSGSGWSLGESFGLAPPVLAAHDLRRQRLLRSLRATAPLAIAATAAGGLVVTSVTRKRRREKHSVSSALDSATAHARRVVSARHAA